MAKIKRSNTRPELVVRRLYCFGLDNRERRLTGAPGKANARPWHDIRADLCGAGGYSISPPSMCNGGTYQLLGDISLEDFLVADGLVALLGGWWSKKKLSEYRRRLLADEWIVMIRRPRHHLAALYRGGPTAHQELFC